MAQGEERDGIQEEIVTDKTQTSQSKDNEPTASKREDEARWKAAQRLFRGPCDFVRGVVSLEGLPQDIRPEVAFAGRSNVGKSSLLNALVGRRALARTSHTPGRTRELNFFDLGGKLYLVDMPGYGYARASRAQVEGWTRLIHDYLRGRPQLKRVMLLLDSRHGIKPPDETLMALLDKAAVSYQAVLTKTDKLKASEADKVLARVSETLAKHPAAHPEILRSSARKGWGLDALRHAIFELLPEND